MIELKEFQIKAANEILDRVKKILSTEGDDKRFIFQSPTGSGKTVMMSEFLRLFNSTIQKDEYVFLWISVYDLHNQSKEKLQKFLDSTEFNLIDIEEVNTESLDINTIRQLYT